MASDLLFKGGPKTNPTGLIFGEDDSAFPPRDVSLNATFELSFTARVGPRVPMTLNATFALTCDTRVTNDPNVARPLVSEVFTDYQTADALHVGTETLRQSPQAMRSGFEDHHQQAEQMPVGVFMPFQHADTLRIPSTEVRHQDAIRVPTWLVRSRHQNSYHDRRTSALSRFQSADKRRHEVTTDYQNRYRDRRPSLRGLWQEAQRLAVKHDESLQSGVPYFIGLGSRYQEAMVPMPGEAEPPIPPEPPPCYEPDANLLFKDIAAINGDLVFICETDSGPPATVVVPVKRVYVVINTVSLRRVANDLEIPALSMSLSIDVDSWTWGFNATLPGGELNNVLPDNDGPIELEASINGNLYRVLAERISSERSFAQKTIRVSGRGKSALLAAPYSVLRTFTNDTARTAQQLMADVLTFNGVPIGWDIDWQLDDWLVPAGAFSLNGSYMDGLNAIAGAAGAYLQPNPVDQELQVLHRYPFAPWEWGTVSPDFDLPSAVTLQEGIEWDEKPDYNRVYVSGTSQGILGRVTRLGTDGALLAPMVSDALITETAAARQRGRAILSNTGRQARVSLKLPVLEETGIITPGKFVRYNDGVTERIGIVRQTSVDAGWPEVWQSITVETHV